MLWLKRERTCPQIVDNEILYFLLKQIFYLVTDTPQEQEENRLEEELEVVPATYNSHSLVFLDKFTEYRIQIVAFNPAGDGPRSKAITVKTLQVK